MKYNTLDLKSNLFDRSRTLPFKKFKVIFRTVYILIHLYYKTVILNKKSELNELF
jgi:hypothetical protein